MFRDDTSTCLVISAGEERYLLSNKVIFKYRQGKVLLLERKFLILHTVLKGLCAGRIFSFGWLHNLESFSENCGATQSLFCWFFIVILLSSTRLKLSRHELDNPHKSKTWHVFQEDFSVTVELEQDSMTKAY